MDRKQLRTARGLTSSTPASVEPIDPGTFTKLPNLSESFTIPHTNAAPTTIPAKATNSKVVTKRTAVQMICAAIEATGVPKKGASYLAIKKWILDNQQMDPKKALLYIKKALSKGLESGVLARPSKSKDIVGARGYFIILEKEIKKKPAKVKLNEKQKAKDGTKRNPKSVPVLEVKKTQITPDNIVVDGRRAKGKPTKDADAVHETPKKEKEKIPSRTVVKSEAQQVVAVKQNAKVRKPKTTAETTEPKPSSSTAHGKGANSKKLYTSQMKPVLGRGRKDFSDTELEVNRTPRKSLKSYSSDTEVEVAKSAASNRLGNIGHGSQKGVKMNKNAKNATTAPAKKGRKPNHTASDNVNAEEASKPHKTRKEKAV